MVFDNVAVYSTTNWTFEDRLQVYASEILPNIRCNEVEEALVSYITETVEPVGWKAIWRPTLTSCGYSSKLDYLVEVVDVSQFKLEAHVTVLESGSPKKNGSGDTSPKKLPKNISVPLIELYPVHDENSSGLYDKTAEAIEHIKFFYENIWRPWDIEDEENCVFVDHYLEPRLKLYYEMVNKVIPNRLITKIQTILKTAGDNQSMLDDLEKEMHFSDCEREMDEKDVLQCAEIRFKQSELRNDLELLENPTLRALFIKKDLALSSIPRGRRQNSEVVLHIVTNQLLAGMLRDLPSSTIVEHHSQFSSAVSAAYENDTIWVFPGVYDCDGLGWFDDSISVEGKGCKPEDVVIKVNGNTDIFINCNAQDLKLSNLTIEVSNYQFTAIMVHRGCTTLKNCVIKNGQIGVCGNAFSDIIMFDCKIIDSELCCVNANSMSSLTIKECEFHNFENCALSIQLEGDDTVSRPIKIFKNRFYGNGQYGLIFYSEDQNIRDMATSTAITKIIPDTRQQLSCFEIQENDFQRSELNPVRLYW